MFSNPSLLPLLGGFTAGVLAALLVILFFLERRQKRATREARTVLETHLARGVRAREEGRLDEAIQHHLRALELDREHQETLFALAEDYQAAGQPGMARDHLRRILSLHRNEPRALTWLRDLTVAEERWDEALGVQERLLRCEYSEAKRRREKARLVGIRYEAGKVALVEGRTHDARRFLQEVIRDNPDFVPGYLALGDALKKLGNAREAIRVWEQGLERTGAPPLLRRLEEHERELGHPNEMIHRALQALARAPDDPTLTFYMGRVYLELSMLDEATEHFERLAALAPEIATFHAYLGNLLERRGKMSEALVEYGQALRIRRMFDLPHRCGECGTLSAGWADRCERCGWWNSIHPVSRGLPLLPPPPPPHGGRQP